YYRHIREKGKSRFYNAFAFCVWRDKDQCYCFIVHTNQGKAYLILPYIPHYTDERFDTSIINRIESLGRCRYVGRNQSILYVHREVDRFNWIYLSCLSHGTNIFHRNIWDVEVRWRPGS